jgi:two-component sensor histidine kinase
MTLSQYIWARLLAPPRRGAPALLYSVLSVVIPTLLRAVLDPIASEVGYVCYYPFVMLSALFMNWRYATGVAIGSAIAGNYLFMAPRYVLFAAADDTISALVFLLCSGFLIGMSAVLRRTIRQVETGLKKEAYLNAELRHRVKNTIAVAQGLAMQSFRGTPAADGPLRMFLGRLHALAAAQDILTGDDWKVCRLPDLADQALAPFNEQRVVTLMGPGCILPDASCVPLVLALHELGVNAVKYGALSAPRGSVELAWLLRDDGASGDYELVLRWTERGGPPVQSPTRRGLGSRLLTAQPGLKAVTVDFRPEGGVCEIRVKGAELGLGAPRARLRGQGGAKPLWRWIHRSRARRLDATGLGV